MKYTYYFLIIHFVISIITYVIMLNDIRNDKKYLTLYDFVVGPILCFFAGEVGLIVYIIVNRKRRFFEIKE